MDSLKEICEQILLRDVDEDTVLLYMGLAEQFTVPRLKVSIVLWLTSVENRCCYWQSARRVSLLNQHQDKRKYNQTGPSSVGRKSLLSNDPGKEEGSVIIIIIIIITIIIIIKSSLLLLGIKLSSQTMFSLLLREFINLQKGS